MSPRAAWRFESLGFAQVHDYAAGEADWLAYGHPSEGSEAAKPRAGVIARRDVPTCSLDDRLGDVRNRVETAGWDECVVVNHAGVVLGRVRGEALGGDAEELVGAVMEPGPTTIRPDEPLATLVPRLRDKRVGRIIVTTPDGRLVGLVERDVAERALGATEEDHD